MVWLWLFVEQVDADSNAVVAFETVTFENPQFVFDTVFFQGALHQADALLIECVGDFVEFRDRIDLEVFVEVILAEEEILLEVLLQEVVTYADFPVAWIGYG